MWFLHVKVGLEDMGDGQPPWIPSLDETAQVEELFREKLGDDVKIVVTHLGVDSESVWVDTNADRV